MASLPYIHLIQASDAEKQSDRLQEILQKLQSENRISGFVAVNVGEDLHKLNNIKGDDLALTLLTHGIEAQKKDIEGMLSTLKGNHPSIKIAELIVDHVPYENEYLTFPEDLKPIRDREGISAVWNSIEQSLKDMFPVQKPIIVDKSKYLKIAGVLVALILVIFIIIRLVINDNGIIKEEILAEFTTDKIDCEVPCTVTFTNNSQNAASYLWAFGDGQSSIEKNPSHTYNDPGNYTVKLKAQNGDNQKEKETSLKINPKEENNVFTVTKVEASVAGASNVSAKCPHLFNFNGIITVNMPGTVKYTWLRNDGATSPVQTLQFTEPGSKTVSTSWTLGGAGQNYNNRWQQLKIVEPSEMLSDKALFNLTCEAEEVAIVEDCINFNPQNVEAKNVNGSWKIVDGNHWMFDFGNKSDDAKKGAAIIRHYGLNKSCFVGRPGPSFKYMLVGNNSPAGNAPGEDCINFNPGTIEVKQINNIWKIVDGSHWMFDFESNRQEAEQTFAIIKKYGFNKSCYVGRPNPPMSYLRR